MILTNNGKSLEFDDYVDYLKKEQEKFLSVMEESKESFNNIHTFISKLNNKDANAYICKKLENNMSLSIYDNHIDINDCFIPYTSFVITYKMLLNSGNFKKVEYLIRDLKVIEELINNEDFLIELELLFGV